MQKMMTTMADPEYKAKVSQHVVTGCLCCCRLLAHTMHAFDVQQ